MEDKLLALTLTMGMINSSVMSLKRYQLLLRFFHIRDNSTCLPRGDPYYDPLFKISELIVQLNDTFMNYYTPARDVAVDESLVGFKGRHYFVQYMPNKHHHQWGPKLWVAAESETGYTFQFDGYRYVRMKLNLCLRLLVVIWEKVIITCVLVHIHVNRGGTGKAGQWAKLDTKL